MDHQDDAIDRVLRRGAAQPATAAPGGCLDGELLAAWSERALPPPEMARVERHLADCARCLEMAAVFTQVQPAEPEPIPQPVVPGFAALMKWALPLTAVIAVAVWVAIPERIDEPEPVTMQRPAPAITPDAAPPQSRAAQSATPQSAAPRAGPPPAGSRRQPPTAEQTVAVVPEGPQRFEATETAQRTEAPAAPAESKVEREVRDAALVPPPPPEPAPPAAARAPLPVPKVAPPPSGQVAGGAPAPLPPPPPQPQTAAVARETAGGGAALAETSTGAASLDVVTPDPRIRWRIVSGRELARTDDGGARWQQVPLKPAAPLLAGSSPSVNVLWVVGQRGTIYLSTDALRFDLVPFPESTDLISVTAVDGQQATVRARDGRTWRTTDRGNTWVVVP